MMRTLKIIIIIIFIPQDGQLTPGKDIQRDGVPRRGTFLSITKSTTVVIMMMITVIIIILILIITIIIMILIIIITVIIIILIIIISLPARPFRGGWNKP